MKVFTAMTLLVGLCAALFAVEPQQKGPHHLEKGVYVVTGRVVSGTLIANFGLNIGDTVAVSEDGKTMTVLKSGRKFPLAPDEPNLAKLEDRITQMEATVKEDADELARINASMARCDLDIRDTLNKMTAILSTAQPTTGIVFNNSTGTYVVTSQNALSFEQMQMFNDLNKRLGQLRREMKQLQKQFPDSEADLDRDSKLLAKYKADLEAFKKDNPQPTSPTEADKELRERLTKLKALFNDGLLTKEQYDRSVKEALDANKR